MAMTLLAEPLHDVIDHPSGFLALSPRNRRFQLPCGPGFLAYREQGLHLIALGGVHALPEDQPLLLDKFLAFAKQKRRRVIVVQVRAEQAELFRSRGFTVNRLGATYGLRLPGFSCAGTRRMKVRQKVKQARAAALRVAELGQEWPADEVTFAHLHEVSRQWLAARGKKELDFMVGELGRPGDPDRRIFVALNADDEVQGFISYVPVWGGRPGYLHDLTRRRPDAPVGCMELCNACAIERFQDEDVPWLHLGFTPFIQVGDEPPGASRILARLIHLLGHYGAAIYPAQSQAAYKRKWAPDFVEPEYVAARPLSLRAVIDVLLLTRSL